MNRGHKSDAQHIQNATFANMLDETLQQLGAEQPAATHQ